MKSPSAAAALAFLMACAPEPTAAPPADLPPEGKPDRQVVCEAAAQRTEEYCRACTPGKDCDHAFFWMCEGWYVVGYTAAEYHAKCDSWWEAMQSTCSLGTLPSPEPPSCSNPFDPSGGT